MSPFDVLSRPMFGQTSVIAVMRNTLGMIDGRLVDHGERVAYIIHEILAEGGMRQAYHSQDLFLLAIFHDIGAYKTDELDKMLQFETGSVWNHALYGYLFLKNMTPLEKYAEVILYHHLDYQDLAKLNYRYEDYAALIYLADRADILLLNDPKASPTIFAEQAGQRYSPRFAYLLQKIWPRVSAAIANGSYHHVVEQIIRSFHFTQDQLVAYLKMLVYSIDFRSVYTVSHTINTTAISVELGRQMGLTSDQLAELYIGALIHDLGKIAIPLEILENPGRLSKGEMTVMRTHVTITGSIIRGLVSKPIYDIATAHHEKLDGSGYPLGLTGEQLNLPQRIMAAADILSALSSVRSYKEIFPKEKTLAIFQNMKSNGQLDPTVCQIILTDYDNIMHLTDASRDPVLQMYSRLGNEYLRFQKHMRNGCLAPDAFPCHNRLGNCIEAAIV